MTPLLAVAILLYVVNAALFAVLAYVYGRTALSTRAKYPLGLFIFSVLLLIHSVGTAAAYLFLSPYFLDEAVPFMSIMGGVELVGVSALLKITL
jgi:hypothetical protein